MAIEYKHKVNKNGSTNVSSATETFFDINYIESSESPIDSFFLNTKDLNIISATLSISPALTKKTYNLILLGQISAVESYIREVIRKLIINDEESKNTSSTAQLTYGAALNYSKEILPEALMESYSFASKKNILDALKTFLNIKGHFPIELTDALVEFERICQLRHCIIHRFGKLGSNNALKLGLDAHAQCLEKPLSLDTSHLLETYIVSENLVLLINNFLFKSILQRTVQIDGFWTWDFRKDKKKFTTYYNIFKSLQEPEIPNTDLKTAYLNLREYKKELIKKERR
jgi:hypothetical protein